MDIGAALNVNSPVTAGTPTPGLTLAPPPAGQPAAAIPPQRNLASEWSTFLNQPGNRQALVQMGLAMMQPVGLGQSGIGHLANAMGQGAQAKDRYLTGRETLATKNRELDIQSENNRRTAQLSSTALLANNRSLSEDFQTFVFQQAKLQAAAEADPLDVLADPNAKVMAIYQKLLTDPEQVSRMQELWQASRSYGGPSGGPTPVIGNSAPASAREYLKGHPELAPQFDQKYGQGSAKAVLGGP